MKEYEELGQKYAYINGDTDPEVLILYKAYKSGFLKAREMVDKLCTQHFNELPSSFVRLIEDLGEKEV